MVKSKRRVPLSGINSSDRSFIELLLTYLLIIYRRNFLRSETDDFQRGEVEWRGGNIYFDKWDYFIDVKYLEKNLMKLYLWE